MQLEKLTPLLSGPALTDTFQLHVWDRGVRLGIEHRGLAPIGVADSAGDGTGLEEQAGVPAIEMMPLCQAEKTMAKSLVSKKRP